MDVDDFYLLLHHHWVLDTSAFPEERQRVQLALLVLFQGGTATRPSALVYSAIDKAKLREHYIGWERDDVGTSADSMDIDIEGIQTICYEDVNLCLLPGPEGERDLLAMDVTLKYTKGWQLKPNPYVLSRSCQHGND